MKSRKLFTIAALLVLFMGKMMADNLTVQSLKLAPGEQQQVAISLNNGNNKYVAFQLDLVLPDGVTIATDDNGKFMASLNSNRIDDHSLNVQELDDGTFRVLSFSMTNSAFYGTSGELLYVTLKAGENTPEGSVTAKIVSTVFSDANANQYPLADVNIGINIAKSKYTLSVKATGQGSASYSGTQVRATTTSFTVNEGTSSIITFIPDYGYRIKSVKVNGSDVSSMISGNQYTLSSISADTIIEVTFEASNNILVDNYPSQSAEFDLSNGMVVFESNWSEFSWYVLTMQLDNMTKEQFESYYEPDLLSTNIGTTTDGRPIGQLNIFSTYTQRGDANPRNDIGIAKYYANWQGTGSSRFTWELSAEELRQLTNSTGSVQIVRYVRFKERTGLSRHPAYTYVYIAMRANLTQAKVLTVKSTGNGYVRYNGSDTRNTTNTYTVSKGSSATLTITPDNGYRVKSVKVNGSDVTSSVSNNSYTVNSINSSTTIEVEFEVIPLATYTLSIKSTGNGSASYDGTTIRSKTSTFTLNEGSSATITFTPDAGYKIKSVMVNGIDVTSSLSSNKYTVSSISKNTSVEVEFEAIPPTTYTLSIKSTGNGTAAYDGSTIRSKTITFTVNEGSSATITFTPDAGYRIKSVKVNGTDVTTSLSSNKYTVSSISKNTTVEVEFEAITYTLSIKSTGNGYVTYDGITVSYETRTFTVIEGTYATININPDAGYRIKSITVNGFDATSDIYNNQYTISSIYSDTAVEVEFEIIPPITYSLSIKSTGNGSVTYDGTAIRSKTNTFTVNEGLSATITFTPDAGYILKSVKVNGTDVTSSVSNNRYTVSNISSNTSIEVEFEAITYTLSIKSIGNGIASYNGTTIRSKTSTFTANEGSSATIAFTPDAGYRTKSVKVNGTDVTSNVSNNQFIISNISGNTSVEVEFEAIPPTTYNLSIKSTGYGSASYEGTAIRSKTSTFTVNEGSSVVITFTPDAGYRIKSVKVNGTDVTSSVSNGKYTVSNISKNTNVEVEFEAITHTLTIKSTGSGTATYNSSTIRSKTSTFIVNEGSSATISFTPDTGYRIKSVKVNGTDVTSSLSSNKYAISNIQRNTSVEVEFEAITHTLSITSTGNGLALFNGTSIRGKTSTFTLNEGSSATITFTPDAGNKIKSVKVNGTDVTSTLSSNKYTVSSISGNTSVEVEFEAITHTLSITSTGNGSASYSETSVRGKTSTFTLNEGSSATITFTPDEGYKIKSVKVDGTDVTSSLSSNEYTVSNISSDANVEVVFEAITHTLAITSTGSGLASYNGTTVSAMTSTFTVNEGSSVTVSFTPDNGYRIKEVKADGAVVASNVSNYQYAASMLGDITLEVVFMEELASFTKGNVNYTVTSYDSQTVRVAKGSYGATLEVPEQVDNQDLVWRVTGIDTGALAGITELAAIVWNPEEPFTAEVKNPNLLLYVKSADYAPASVKNVVVNGTAKSITLTDATNGNDFYCPQEFTAQRISYTHNYMMTTGIGESRGWETIALPFDVQQVTHQSGGELVPFAKWQSGNEGKPFWLMELGSSGWTEATAIKANTPYIISMPNNENYKPEFRVNGNVTFKAENVTVRRSDEVESGKGNGKTFVPNFTNQESAGYYALNVSNDYVTYSGGAAEGSRFVAGLRPVRPFEAYMTSEAGVREIAIADDLATGIAQAIVLIGGRGDTKVYDLKGRVVADGAGCSQEELRRMLPYGVYIFNGRKLIVK